MASFDYDAHSELFKQFLLEFPKESSKEDKKYPSQLQALANKRQTVLELKLDEFDEFFGNSELSSAVEGNTVRYLNLFADVIESTTPTASMHVDESDAFDIMLAHRTQRLTAQHLLGNAEASAAPGAALTALPKELLRRFELQLIPRSQYSSQPLPLRQVRSAEIGRLVTIKGIVTRISEVKPLLVVATYTCDSCGFELFQRVTAKQFMPLRDCPSARCAQNARERTPLNLQTRGSKFVKFQEVRVQELPDQVPIGHVPRALTVHLNGELTRTLSPGDIATLHGVFLPVPHTGFNALKKGLVASTFVQALAVQQHKKKYSDLLPDAATVERVERLQRTPHTYAQLAASIAPELYGLEDVKKALLLMMVGGVTRNLTDGMRIRGDINVCLVGDPGVAKSQLLKHIASIAPRGVYTSGKGSSGVGLTAAVVKDPLTNELVLEGGSLVLADRGICAIDEFDKMDESDRTAIHEVMEQQTISIAKAGITTTLNARTAILAAANPLYGRYNPSRPPSENINLPAALLSRFDLLFLLLDNPDPTRDRELAEHVTYVHRHGQHPPNANSRETFPPEFMRAYVAIARRFEPFIPPELRTHIVDAYISMREAERSGDTSGSGFSHGYTTARTLLAILRLSQSMARIRFSLSVHQQDVEEAMRLMSSCQQQLRIQKKQKEQRRADPVSDIYHLVRDFAVQRGLREVKYDEILPRVLAVHSQRVFDQALDEYERLNVWLISSNRSKITFVDQANA